MKSRGVKHLSIRVGPALAGKRLDVALAEWLPEVLSFPLSKAKVRKLIVAGAVYLNRRRVRIASKTLQEGARVEVYVDLARLVSDEAPSQDVRFELSAPDVLFEDEDLIVVNKPALLPTQPTLDQARDCLYAAVKRFLARRDGVADPYVGLHHRLDRDTSGVILFSKTKKANPGLASLFAEHRIEKVYLALVGSSRALPYQAGEEWEVRNFLAKAPGTRPARQRSVHSGGQAAQTGFRIVDSFPRGALIEARPRTGRMHQIRVHLAEEGMPILGDPLYGSGRSESARRTMLHAATLTFVHPLTRVEISVSSPLPEDFQTCLNSLKV